MRVVPTKGDRPRPLALRDAASRFEAHALVGPVRPGEEEPGHPCVGLDAVREHVVDRLVAAKLEAPLPRAFDERGGRGDHEEQVDDLAEAREQVAAGLIGVGREAVEPEAVDEKVRHAAVRGLARHVPIELVVDDGEFLTCEGGRVLVGVAKAAVIDELLAPDVRADECELRPVDANPAREAALQRAQRALARCRWPLGVHDDGALLPRHPAEPFAVRGLSQHGLERGTDPAAPASLHAMPVATAAMSSRVPHGCP